MNKLINKLINKSSIKVIINKLSIKLIKAGKHSDHSYANIRYSMATHYTL